MTGIAPVSELVARRRHPQAWFTDVRQATRSVVRKEVNTCLMTQAPKRSIRPGARRMQVFQKNDRALSERRTGEGPAQPTRLGEGWSKGWCAHQGGESGPNLRDNAIGSCQLHERFYERLIRARPAIIERRIRRSWFIPVMGLFVLAAHNTPRGTIQITCF